MAKVMVSWFKNVHYRLLVAIFIVLACATICTPFLEKYLVQELSKKTQQVLLDKAVQERQRIELYISDQMALVSQCVQDAALVEVCGEVAAIPAKTSLAPALAEKFKGVVEGLLINKHKAINAFFVNKLGIVLATAVASPYLEKNLASLLSSTSALEASFMRVLMGMSGDVSEYAFDPVLGVQALFISYPVFKEFKLQGILMVQVAVDFLHNVVPIGSNVVGNAEVNFVKNKDLGVLYLSKNKKSGGVHNFVSQEQIKTVPAFAPSLALAGQEGSGITYDSALKKKISAWSYIPKVDWGVVVESFAAGNNFSWLRILFWILLFTTILCFLFMEIRNPVVISFSYTSSHKMRNWVILLVGLSGVLCVLYYLYSRRIDHHNARANRDMHVKIDQLEKATTKNLNKIFRVGLSLVDDLSSGRLKNEDMPIRLQRAIEENPLVDSVAIIHATLSTDGKPLAPVVATKKPEGLGQLTAAMHDRWYTQALGGFHCFSRLSTRNDLDQVSYYAMPFFASQDKARSKAVGVVFVEYSMHPILQTISAFQPGKGISVFLTAEDGALLFHTQTSLVSEKKDILFFAQKNAAGADLYNFFKDAFNQKRESGSYTYYNTTMNQNYCADFLKIPGANWMIGASYPVASELADATMLKHTFWPWALILGAGILLIVFLLVLLRLSKVTPFLVSLAGSVSLLALLLGFVAAVCFLPRIVKVKGEMPFVSPAQVDNFVYYQMISAESVQAKMPDKIPVALFVDSLAFESSDLVAISGRIWAHYTDETKALAGNFNFIHAEGASTFVKEAESLKDKVTTIKWHFTAKIKQKTNVLLYPFDTPDIRIKLEYADPSKNVLLIPSLQDYENTIPSSKPGLKQGFAIEGYSFSETFFTYDAASGNADKKVLTYTVTVERDVLYALLGLFLMIVILFGGFFAGLYLIANNKMTVFVSCVAYSVFILAIFGVHQFVRARLAPGGVLYVEMPLFLLYMNFVVLMGHFACSRWLVKKGQSARKGDGFIQWCLLYFAPINLAAMIVATWVMLL